MVGRQWVGNGLFHHPMCCYQGSPTSSQVRPTPISHGLPHHGGPTHLPYRWPLGVPEDGLNMNHAGSVPAGRQPLAFSMTGKCLPSPSISPTEAGQGKSKSCQKALQLYHSPGGASCPGAAGRPWAFGSSPERLFSSLAVSAAGRTPEGLAWHSSPPAARFRVRMGKGVSPRSDQLYVCMHLGTGITAALTPHFHPKKKQSWSAKFLGGDEQAQPLHSMGGNHPVPCKDEQEGTW